MNPPDPSPRWTYRQHMTDKKQFVIAMPGNESTFGREIGFVRGESNAAHIVKVLNVHADLVTALLALNTSANAMWIMLRGSEAVEHSAIEKALKASVAAIAKAEGRP